PNNMPRPGTSPNRGTRFLDNSRFSEMMPPSAMLSPSFTVTWVSTERMLMLGDWIPLPSRGATGLLTSCWILNVTHPLALILGVTFRITPVLRFWIVLLKSPELPVPPGTTPWEVKIGTSDPTWILAAILSEAITEGDDNTRVRERVSCALRNTRRS